MSTKRSNVAAAPYPKTDHPETSAIQTLGYLLRDPSVKPHLASGDKRPNIDGDIELVDLWLSSIGKFEVQVKCLSSKDQRRRGYSCDVSFLAYCAKSLLPVLLIGVHPDKELALWEEITRPLARSLLKKAAQSGERSITVRFPVENLIQRGTKGHISAWQNIVEKHQLKLEFSDELSPKAAYLRQIATSIEQIGSGIPDPQEIDFTNLQIHIDEINALLERAFPTVRDTLFRGAWKIGVAFSIYAEDALSYCYYPIRRGVNDLMVRRISSETFEQLPHDRTIHPFENPIQLDPVGFGREYVEQQVVDLLNEKAFRFDDLILGRELLFSVADALSAQLGLRKVRGSIGQKLDLKKFAYGWTYYLPHWVNYAAQAIPVEILNNLRSLGSLHGYVDLGALEFSLACTDKKPHHIRASVHEQILSETPVSIPFSVGTRDLPLHRMKHVIELLLSSGQKELKRLYTPLDYGQLSGEGGPLSSCWTYDQCLENLRLFYREFPRVFEHIVERNFPFHRDELRYFDDFDRRVMILTGNGSVGYHLLSCDLRSKDADPANRIDLYAEQDGIKFPDVDPKVSRL